MLLSFSVRDVLENKKPSMISQLDFPCIFRQVRYAVMKAYATGDMDIIFNVQYLAEAFWIWPITRLFERAGATTEIPERD